MAQSEKASFSFGYVAFAIHRKAFPRRVCRARGIDAREMKTAESHVRETVGALCIRYKAEDLACRGVPTEDLRPGMLAELLREREELRKRLIDAFVSGAKWWEWKKEGATMWQGDQREAEEAARKKLGLD